MSQFGWDTSTDQVKKDLQGSYLCKSQIGNSSETRLQIPIFDYGAAENNTMANQQQQKMQQSVVKQNFVAITYTRYQN